MNYYPKLKLLIDKIDELLKTPDLTADTKEFVDWQIRTELFLSRCYGSQSIELERFQKVEFSALNRNGTTEDAIWQCKSGLYEARNTFEIYLEELADENYEKGVDSMRELVSRTTGSLEKQLYKPVNAGRQMKKKYQVFISSTYEDLKEERVAITQCLLDNNCIPVGMEQFPASNMSQMEYIEKMLDDCDYYILIIGGRYGSLDDDGVGYTEKEYNYAQQKGIPVMAFVNLHPEKLPNEKCEHANIEKFKAFRDRVLNAKKTGKRIF